MKTALKFLTIVGFAIAALTWPLFKVSSTEEEDESTDKDEFKVSEITATAGERAQDAQKAITGREAYRRMQLQDENGEIPPNAWNEALPGEGSNAVSSPSLERVHRRWGGSSQSLGSDRTGQHRRQDSFDYHSSSTPNTMWVGGVSGGVWKSTNGGHTWSTNTDFLANLAVNCMAMDATGPDITLYAGTGEGPVPGDAMQGNGIFKSIDGGSQWTQLAVHGSHAN